MKIRIPYAIGFFITGIILLALIPPTRRSTKKIARKVLYMLISSVVLVFSNLVQELSISPGISLFAYCFFFLSMSLLCYYALRFVMEYTSYPEEHPLWLGVLEVLLAVDAISIVSNLFLKHAYTVETVFTKSGEMFYSPVGTVYFRLHLFLLYGIIAITLYLLIRKLYQTPQEYWGKYLIIVGITVALIVWDGIFIIMKTAVNQSVFGFAVLNIMLYYFSLVYVPNVLLDHLHARIVGKLTDGILFFDTDRHCIYANDRARELVGAGGEDLELCEQYIDSWENEGEVDFSSNFHVSRPALQEGERHLDVEYQRLFDDKDRFIGGIFTLRDMTQTMEALEEQRYIATHDQLTGLLNRRGFLTEVERILLESGEPYLMINTNIRDFKFINEIFGVEKGDEILRQTARIIRDMCGEGESCGRLTADRFALFVKHESFDERQLLTRMDSVSEMVISSNYSIHVHIGVYEITERGISADLMCDRANMAINTIRNETRNDVAYYNDELKEEALHERRVLSEFESALVNKQFHIFLQPQFTADGELVGAEALVRWFHPEHGIMNPGSFVEILERSGMVYRMDRCVWELAAQLLSSWKGTEKEDLSISVNISPRDFYYIDLYSAFTGLVERYDIDPRKLKLEITETALMNDTNAYNNLFARLHAYGFEIEMDDFGSGYSSLSMLKEIYVDILKIDMAFLRETESTERGQTILRAMIALAKDLRMPVITEGVETLDQVEFLTELGSEMFQGYYFSKPLPISEFEEKYFPEDGEEI